MPKHKILIVDDEPLNLKLLEATLRSSYEISIAASGPEAIETAKTPPAPDLILLDIMMPGMDGYAVCRALQTDDRTQNIPVIFLTARTEDKDEARGFELGAVDYITKPFRPAVLKARISTQLELKLYRDHLEERVEQRTMDLTSSNKQLQLEIARRRSAQRDLQRANEELERRVEKRTAELLQSNADLRNLLTRQEVNIDLSKSILRLNVINLRLLFVKIH